MIFLNDERSRSKLSTTTIYISFFDTNLKVLWSNFPEILSFFMSLPFLKILQFSSELFNNSSILFNKIFLSLIGALLKFRYLKNAVFSLKLKSTPLLNCYRFDNLSSVYYENLFLII